MTGQEIIKLYDAMDGDVGNWKNLWQECADWSLPTNDNINRIRVEGQEKPAQRMIDTCIEANFNFASGFFSHMFPPNSIWAKYRHPDPKMMDNMEVADYWERVSHEAHQILLGSNFAQEEFQALLAMGAFGTNCLAVEEDEKETLRFRNFIVSNIRIAENHLGQVDTVAREWKLRPRQAVQKFGEEALRKAELGHVIEDAKSAKDKKYTFIHYVCPREDYVVGSNVAKELPIKSVYVSRDSGQIVKEGGMHYNPFKCARFTTGNDEVYGRGPMSMVLGTARRTNVVYRSMIVSAEQNANPQWLVPDDDSVSGMSGRSGAIIKWRATNPNGRPERLQSNGDTGIAVEMYELHDAQIKRMFFNHLFRPLDDYRNMTAFEVSERMTTDLMTLAPFVSRYLDEHVTPIMEHVYYILQKRKKLPPMPAVMLEDPNFEIDYVGRLSMATKSFETMGAISTLRIMGELGQAIPQLMAGTDNVNPDKFFRDVWYSNSSSMNALYDPKKVEDDRAAREQAMQQQQAIDNLAPTADAAQKLSGAVDPNSIIANMEQ